jgi:anti-anti-sigma factor
LAEALVRPYLSPDQHTADLRVDVRPVGPARTRIIASGELDAAADAQLAPAVRACLHEQEARDIEVDLAGVTFLDSAGIRCLLTCWNQADLAGCRMRLSNPDPMVRRILEITGLLEMFDLDGDMPPAASTGGMSQR